MEVIKNKRILAIVGIVTLIVACFLPYFTISFFGYTQSFSLWGYWEGKVIFVLALANALFIFQDFIEKWIPALANNWIGNIVRKTKNPKFALIPTILVAIFAITLIVQLDGVTSEYIKYGLGFYVLWVGIVALVGHSIFYKGNFNSQVSQPVNNVQMVQPTNNVMTNQSLNNVQQPINNVQPQQPANSFCPYCGGQVPAGANNCPNCGSNL